MRGKERTQRIVSTAPTGGGSVIEYLNAEDSRAVGLPTSNHVHRRATDKILEAEATARQG